GTSKGARNEGAQLLTVTTVDRSRLGGRVPRAGGGAAARPALEPAEHAGCRLPTPPRGRARRVPRRFLARAPRDRAGHAEPRLLLHASAAPLHPGRRRP